MSNTTFQIKRSINNPQPSGGSLLVGEIAYSYNSNVFFIGSSAGNDVLPIGGKYYTDKTNVKTILNSNAGKIDYQEGVVSLTAFGPSQVNNTTGELAISVKPTTTIISDIAPARGPSGASTRRGRGHNLLACRTSRP